MYKNNNFDTGDKVELLFHNENSTLHFYKYQRTKTESIDLFGEDSFLCFANLYEEQQIFKGYILVEIKTKDVRDFYTRFAANNIPCEYKELEKMDDEIQSYILTKQEYLTLADRKKTDDIAFSTFKK